MKKKKERERESNVSVWVFRSGVIKHPSFKVRYTGLVPYNQSTTNIFVWMGTKSATESFFTHVFTHPFCFNTSLNCVRFSTKFY